MYDVEIPLKNGQSRGYGFVTFEKQTDALRAIQSMDGQVINGRSMQVRDLKPALVKIHLSLFD